MSRIKSNDTKPEMLVRSLLHKSGFRFRLHRKDLAGKPDIVLPKYNTVIFVNGCFWHCHKNCKRATIPKTNKEFWESKFKKNIERDKKNKKILTKAGWKVIIIWECEIIQCDSDLLIERLKKEIVSPCILFKKAGNK